MLPNAVRTLDVGCGESKAHGALGIDCRPLPTVDLVHNLDEYPWPVADDSFDVIICRQIVEHVSDLPRFFRELHRVGAAGAKVRVETPHFSSLDSWTDPSHRHHLSSRSFDFFAADGYLNGGAVFRVDHVTLTFRKAVTSQLAQFLFKRWPTTYEQNLAFMLPARDIHADLVVVK